MTTDTVKYVDSLEDELDMLAMEIMEIVPADMMEIMMDKAMKLAKSGILENGEYCSQLSLSSCSDRFVQS